MLKELVLTALLGLCVAIPVGTAAFAAARSCLRRGWRTGCLLAGAALSIGAAYGLLRFCGVILLPGDHTMSTNWFDASWRDNGFRYLYGCGTLLAGIAAAFAAARGGG